jgi:glycosyltransferase involved in cell wall biosynthesis
MKLNSLSLVFPAFNEEKNLPLLLKRVQRDVPLLAEDFEVIVVDDGSQDKTSDLLKDYAREFEWLRYVLHPENRGYGAAVTSGILAARKEYIFFSDADLQFDLRSLACFIPYLAEYKVVFGYRAPRRDNFMRICNAWLWKKLVGILFSLKVKDLDCAFKIFHKDVQQIIAKVKSKGAVFSTELLYHLSNEGWEWIELPVKHYPRQYGSQTGASLKVIFRAFLDLFLFWYRVQNLPAKVFFKRYIGDR